MSHESLTRYGSMELQKGEQPQPRQVEAELITPEQDRQEQIKALRQRAAEQQQHDRKLEARLKEKYGQVSFVEFMAIIREQTDLREQVHKTDRKLGALEHPEALENLSKEDLLDL